MTVIQAGKAYKAIRKQLVARVLQPGQRLIEKAWAEKLNVNRADIRQALSRLLGEGLLKAGEKGGFFVKNFDRQEMEHFNEVRYIIETAAAKLAMERATKADIKKLEHVAQQMQMMAENGYPLGVYEADLRFHEMLVALAHNKKLEQIYKLANLPLTMTIPPANTMDKSTLIDDAREHTLIVKAIKEKKLSKIVNLLQKGLG